jgi:hypothetical protein
MDKDGLVKRKLLGAGFGICNELFLQLGTFVLLMCIKTKNQQRTATIMSHKSEHVNNKVYLYY